MDSNNELNVKLPEYFTDNVRQHGTALPKRQRIEESELQREMRQAKDAARAADRRRRETSPERRKRLSTSASHIALKRKTESDDQRRMRLAKDAARTAERRKKESYSERETRLALDAARHASKRHFIEERPAAGSVGHHEDINNNTIGSVRSAYTPASPFQSSSGSSSHQYHGEVTSHHHHHNSAGSNKKPTPPPAEQLLSSHGAVPSRNESKYGNLLNVIEDLGREIKPTYAGSKMSQDRLRKGIMHARELVRGCLAEVEKKMR